MATHHELIHASIRVVDKRNEGGGVKMQKLRRGMVNVDHGGMVRVDAFGPLLPTQPFVSKFSI